MSDRAFDPANPIPDPDAPDAALSKAISLARSGAVHEARHRFRLILQENPSCLEALVWLGALAQLPQEGVARMNDAAALAPDNAQVAAGLAWAQQRLRLSETQAPVTAPALGPLPRRTRAQRLRTGLSVALIAALVVLAGTVVVARPEVPKSLMARLFAAATSTPTPTQTLAPTVAPTLTRTNTVLPSATATATRTSSPTTIPTNTATATNTVTPTNTATLTPWPQSPKPSATPVPPTVAPTKVVAVATRAIPAPTKAAAAVVAVSSGKWIDVNLSTQHLTAFEGNTAVFSAVVSTGLPATPTVTGRYTIYVKYRSAPMSGPGYYLPGVPYIMYFYGGYGLHGTYWHNNFGYPMSHGCVNLRTSDAAWLFNWAGPFVPAGAGSASASAANPGTQVVIHY